MPVEITAGTVLAVEGKDEVLFFGALLDHMGLQGIQIVPAGGKDQFRSKFGEIVSSAGYGEGKVQSIGIVRDADDDADSAFRSVCGVLKFYKLPVPDKALVSTVSSPRVTAMILPINSRSGALEDLCLQSIAGDITLSCANEFWECLEQRFFVPQGVALSETIVSKLKTHAYLSGKPHKGDKGWGFLQLGVAAATGYWDWNHPTFEQVKGFLQQIAPPAE